MLVLIFAWDTAAAWTARLGGGQIGTWTVTTMVCSDRAGCNPLGRFVADDGGDVRSQVGMSGHPQGLEVTDSVWAVDTFGDQVFPIGGGAAWACYTASLAAAVPFWAVWLRTVAVPIIRRRWRDSRQRGSTVAARPGT
jgi:hypothetical protein